MAIPAGQITRETNIPIRRLPVATATTITKGNVVAVNATGFAIVGPTTQVASRAPYVALETIVNSGADGAVDIPVAVPGHYVTVVSDGTINPGDKVKAATATAGRVIRHVPGTDDNNLVLGVYTGKEGGAVSKSGSTPYLETQADTENFAQVAAAAGDVIELLLASG
jgi:hypothetical protein